MDILDGVLGETPEAVTTPEPQAPELEPNTGPARGPDGKFAPASAEAQPEPAPAPIAEPALVAQIAQAAPEPARPEPGHVPVAALLDERDKRKALEARVQEYERAQQQQQAPEPYQPPSVFEDEAGYSDYVQSQIAQAALNTRLDLSEDMARSRHGEELVDAAKAWALQRFAQSPAFYQEVISQRNPYEYTVQAHKRDQALSQLQDPSELESYLAWKASGGVTAPQAPAPTAPAVVIPQAPSPSLATASSAGGVAHVPTGPGQAFDQTFK